MSSSRRERSGKPRLPDPVRVEAADPKEPLSQTLLGELLGPDYPRLLIALHDATLGDLFFVQLNSPVQRRWLPEQLAADGLQRPFDEGLIENRTLDSLTHSILLPLVCELYDAGRFPEALALLDQVKGIPEKIGDSLDGAAILNMRALVLEALHYFDKAEPLYQGALAIAVKILGPEHPYVATILNNLGALYYDQRKYAEAEALYRRSLAMRERVLGQNHSGVASSLNNLAVLYENQKRNAEAVTLYNRALAILEKTLGPEHPNVAVGLNNLAQFYRILGNYTEAERHCQRALTIWEKTLGPEHPNVARCLENYAVVLRKTNREAEAEKLETRAQAIRAKHAQENPVA